MVMINRFVLKKQSTTDHTNRTDFKTLNTKATKNSRKYENVDKDGCNN